jgi:hypothetical protein
MEGVTQIQTKIVVQHRGQFPRAARPSRPGLRPVPGGRDRRVRQAVRGHRREDRATPARPTAAAGWAIFAIGSLLVATDHDPPADDRRCTVSMTSVDARTGATAWSGAVFSGRNADRTRAKSLALDQVQDIIGAGSRIAAGTETGAPRVFDLATGRTVRAADTAGVPIDSDDRESFSPGSLKLDFVTLNR